MRLMRMEYTVPLAIMIVVLVLASGCVDDVFWDYGHYDKEIQRNYNTDGEREAIYQVENNINLTHITNMTRWEGEWTNFIDHEVIEHYNRSYNTDKEAGREADIYFYYYAWAHFFDDLSFKTRTEGYELLIRLNNEEYLEGFNEPPFLSQPNEMLVLAHLENGSWVYENESYGDNYWEEDQNMELFMNFTNVYFVMMSLTYDDIWGPLAAIWVETSQFLILDEDLDPLVVGVTPSPWIVS